MSYAFLQVRDMFSQMKTFVAAWFGRCYAFTRIKKWCYIKRAENVLVKMMILQCGILGQK